MLLIMWGLETENFQNLMKWNTQYPTFISLKTFKTYQNL